MRLRPVPRSGPGGVRTDLRRRENLGSERVQGIEVGVEARPARGWELRAGADVAAACGVTIPIGSSDSAACQSALDDSGCTDADKQQWGNFGTCLSALPSCTPGNTTAFTSALVTCTTNLSNNLSPNCG